MSRVTKIVALLLAAMLLVPIASRGQEDDPDGAGPSIFDRTDQPDDSADDDSASDESADDESASGSDVPDVDWDALPRPVRAAKERFDKKAESITAAHEAAIERADSRRDDDMAAAIEPLLSEIEKAVKTATRRGDLDAALALREAKEAVAAGNTEAEPPDPRELAIGKWLVTVECYDGHMWTGVFTLDKNGRAATATDGVVAGRGTWQVVDDYVYIRWDSDTAWWESFDLPLDPEGTVGDSWQGKGALKAVKIR